MFASAALFPALKPLWLKRSFILAMSAAFLWLQAPSAVHFFTLLAFVLTGYGAGKLLAWKPSTGLLAGYIVALTAAFVFLKKYAFLQLFVGDTLLAHAVDLIGLSFIFFRQIHYVVDITQGEIKDQPLWGYLAYQLNPFTLLAGPIQRYQRFHEDWQSLAPLPVDGHALRMAFLRILIGVIKVSFIADFCFQLAIGTNGDAGIGQRLMLFYFYPAYVFFNFAGYCDIVIAAASLFGVRVPENFNKPYLARNMIEFWTRWHITLSFWIRDYLFTPLYMAIARRRPSWAPNLAFVCYFVALFLAGVWHGATWNFVVFGILNGLGVSAAKLWENVLIARVGRKGLRTYLANEPIKWIARIATFHFVCLTQIFLRPGSEDNVVALGRKLLALAGLG